MNWLLLLDLWEDWWDGSSPPIHWNPTAQRFEFLVTPPPGQTQQVGLYNREPHTEDGVLDFEYQIDHYNLSSGAPVPRINIIENDSYVISTTTIEPGATGRITVDVRAGNTYHIVVTFYDDGINPVSFYGFEGIITPIQEVAPPTRVLPWWLCVRPDPPEPCPVRTNPAEEFVHFEDYDADFKFPLASSRKPMKIVRPQGCVACGPNLTDAVDPEPDPDPEVLTLCGMYSEGPAAIFHNPAFDPEEPLYVEQNGMSAQYQFSFSENTWWYDSGDNILGWSTPQEILVAQGDREWNAIWHRGGKLEYAHLLDSWIHLALPEGTFPFTLVTEEGSYPAEFDNYQLIWPEGPPPVPAAGEYYMATLDYGFGNTYCCQVNAVTGWG